jgi:hypothetical protein
MEKAKNEAQGNSEVFKALFKAWVADIVARDSTITRAGYWKCYRK